MPLVFDLASVPFSAHGSWMSISIPRGSEELFFRNHHMRDNNIFRIRTLVDGAHTPPEITAEPTRIHLKAGAGEVEICFDGADSVRMRGRGLALQLTGRGLHAYTNGEGLAVLNSRAAFRRYQFEALHGALDLRNAYGHEQEDLSDPVVHPGGDLCTDAGDAAPKQPRLYVIPDHDGCWEIAIDECWSTWERPERHAFEDCLAATARSFADFLDSMPHAPDEFAEARELAAYIDWSCTVRPEGLVKRPSLFMSKNWMCKVWSWDQCFNALALASGQPALALDQMLTLVDHQDEFGAYTDAFNDMEKHYNYAKPPVHGFTLGLLLERLPQKPEKAVIEALYTSLGKQADWWMTHRRMEGQRLPYYLHGNDSGWDNSTMFDRGVPLNAPDLAAFLVVQMETLAAVAKDLGRDDESQSWSTRADELHNALMEELWQGDRFVARLARTGMKVENRSLIPWLALLLGARLPGEAAESLRRGMETHLTDWGLATEHVDSSEYNPDGYWRGPIWAPSTFLAVAGLDRTGQSDLADEIALRFCKLCAKSGMAENFDALTGEGLCDRAYSWTASVFLLLAERLCR